MVCWGPAGLLGCGDTPCRLPLVGHRTGRALPCSCLLEARNRCQDPKKGRSLASGSGVTDWNITSGAGRRGRGRREEQRGVRRNNQPGDRDSFSFQLLRREVAVTSRFLLPC